MLASTLTLIECERVLIRGVATGLLAEAAAADLRAILARTSGHWVVLDLESRVRERACRPFPAEPLRTLDAIHLSTALLARALVPDLGLLSLDARCRRSAEGMGFTVLPDALRA